MIADRALIKHNQHIAQTNRRLAAIEREMAVISEHCDASDDAFQEARQRYAAAYCRAVERVMGLSLERKQAAAALRRLDC